MGNDQPKGTKKKEPLLPSHKKKTQSQPPQHLQPQLLQQSSVMSAEEVRKKRLEKMEKKDHIPQRGLPFNFTNHPIAKEHGNQAYLIHMLFEDIYKNTFHKISLQRNPGLKFLQTHENKKEIPLYTIGNFENVIPDILESDMFYQNDEKLTFLIEVSQRLKTTDQLGLISETEKSSLQKMTLSFLVNYLQAPQIFSPDITQEDLNNYLDYNCILNDFFYEKLIQLQNDEFFTDFILSLQENEFYTILTPILKRIMKNCLGNPIDDISKATMAISLLETLLSKDERIVQFFVNHDLYLLKDSNLTRLELQNKTIFGACLSFTTFIEESNSAHIYFTDPEKQRNLTKIIPELRTKIHTLIDGLHKIMELIIKSNPKFKRNILDWFYCVLFLNNENQKVNHGIKASTHGWFANFLILLFKFCQKLLEDPNNYPNWLSKIDLTYLQEKPIFEKILLLNGLKNTLNNQQETSNMMENQGTKPKYSFLTELLFMTVHALFLHKKSLKENTQLAQVSLGLARNKTNPDIQDFSFLARSMGHCVHLQDPYLNNYIVRLLTFQTLLILHSYDIPIKSIETTHNLFEQIETLKYEFYKEKSSMPVYWVETICDCLQNVGVLHPATLYKSQKCFEILMNFLLCVLKNQQWINLPHIKIGCATFFSIFKTLQTHDSNMEKKLHFVFKQNLYYEKYIVSALIESFVEAESFGSSHYGIHDKFNFRFACCLILEHLLTVIFPQDNFSYAVKGLDRLMYSSKNLYKNFVDSYLDDICFLLDDCFSKLREFHSSNSINSTAFNFLGSIQNNLQIITEKRETVNMFGILKEYYTFGLSICQVFPEFLLNKMVRDQFASFLNYSIKVLNSVELIKMDLPNLKLLKSSPEFLINYVLQIFACLSDNEEFIQSVCSDEKNFQMEDFYGIIKIVEAENILNANDTAKMIRVISKLEKVGTKQL